MEKREQGQVVLIAVTTYELIVRSGGTGILFRQEYVGICVGIYILYMIPGV